MLSGESTILQNKNKEGQLEQSWSAKPPLPSIFELHDIKHYQELFNETFCIKNFGSYEDCISKEKKDAKMEIIIGMHPDQATESIVDMALKYQKPFAVVPCCVFSEENPHRRLKNQK